MSAPAKDLRDVVRDEQAPAEVLQRDLSAAIEAATDYLLSRQDEGGFWRGELRTNVTMDAEDLLLRKFLGILTDVVLSEAVSL